MKTMAAALLVPVLLLSIQLPAAAAAAACSLPSDPFVPTDVVWGTPASPMQVQPGDQGVPLTVSLLYEGCQPVLYGTFSLALPAGFTAANPQEGSTIYLQNIQPFTVSEVTFHLNLAPPPGLNVGNWFASKMSVSFTLDGTNSYFESVGVTDQVLGRVDLYFAARPQSLVAGEVNYLTLTTENKGTGGASQVSTSVAVVPTSAGQPSLSILGSIPEAGSIPASSNYTTVLPLFVPASDAGQALALQFSSTYVDPYSNPRSVAQTVFLFSPSGPESVSLGVVPSANDLPAGDVTNVTFSLENNGSGAATNLTISITPSQQLTVLNLPPRVPLLSPSAQTTFPLQLYASSGAAGSALSITFTVTYQDPYGVTKTFNQNVGFYSPSSSLQTGSPLSITAQPNVLSVGERNNLTVTLTNVGNLTLGDLSVSFASAGAAFTWLSPNQAQDAALPPGENFTIRGSLFDPSQAPASTALQLSITYDKGTVQVVETRSLGLLSRGAIDISLTSLTVLPEVASPGSIVSMTLTLTNLGVVSATGVTATFGFPQGLNAVGSSSSFVGQMQVDIPSTITVSALVANSTAPGTYTVPVKLTYFDNLRNQITQNLTITVPVAAAQAGSGTGQRTTGQTSGGGGDGLILGVVVVGVIIVLAFLAVRRLRKPKPTT